MKRYKEQYMNESIEQKWSIEEFKKFSTFREEIQKKELIILTNLGEFLYFNYELLPPDLAGSVESDIEDGLTLEQTDSFFAKNFTFINNSLTVDISYDDDNDSADVELDNEQFENFIYFMNDPDLYKNTKKYNL